MTHKVRCTACWLLTSHRHAYAMSARLHISTRQSHQTTLAPFASPSAISGTFNSLFKVLFNFPSWYLFAIGLEPIFSFRWNLPPNLHSNPKECDSREVHRAQRTTDDQWDSHPQWCFFFKRLAPVPLLVVQLQTTIQGQRPWFSHWAHPCSFAITEGILFSFFSSTYLYA